MAPIASSACFSCSRRSGSLIHQPALLINLGTCGGVEGRVQCYERLLVERAIVHDIQEGIGDVAEAMQTYSTEVDLTWLGDTLPIQARRATLHSGDVDVVPATLAGIRVSTRRPSRAHTVAGTVAAAVGGTPDGSSDPLRGGASMMASR